MLDFILCMQLFKLFSIFLCFFSILFGSYWSCCFHEFTDINTFSLMFSIIGEALTFAFFLFKIPICFDYIKDYPLLWSNGLFLSKFCTACRIILGCNGNSTWFFWLHFKHFIKLWYLVPIIQLQKYWGNTWNNHKSFNHIRYLCIMMTHWRNQCNWCWD